MKNWCVYILFANIIVYTIIIYTTVTFGHLSTVGKRTVSKFLLCLLLPCEGSSTCNVSFPHSERQQLIPGAAQFPVKQSIVVMVDILTFCLCFA